MTGVAPWIGDVVVLVATGMVTLMVIGVVRIPDAFVKIHAVSLGVVLGPPVVLLAALPGGSFDLIIRALLVTGFMVFTSSAATHALARLVLAERASGGTGGIADGAGEGADGADGRRASSPSRGRIG